MLAAEAVQLRSVAAKVLRELRVDDSTEVLDVRQLADGTWLVAFGDRWPEAKFPTFEVEVPRGCRREEVARELGAQLRAKLWMCPGCQGRADIRRIVDSDRFRVACERCGRFELDGEAMAGFWRGEEGSRSV